LIRTRHFLFLGRLTVVVNSVERKAAWRPPLPLRAVTSLEAGTLTVEMEGSASHTAKRARQGLVFSRSAVPLCRGKTQVRLYRTPSEGGLRASIGEIRNFRT
jgi:hypothetical protein